VEVLGIKTKKLPELSDDFAKDVSDAATLEELKKKVHEGWNISAITSTRSCCTKKCSPKS